jgi:hypothetical protein
MATDNRLIEFSTRYSQKLDQAFTKASYTDRAVDTTGEFKEVGGVASIYKRTIDTSGLLKAYDPTSTTDAYGGRTRPASTLKRYDLDYNISLKSPIDEVDLSDTSGQMEAGRVLGLIQKQELVPMVDKDRFATAIEAATAFGGANVVTFDAAAAYENVLDAQSPLNEALSTPADRWLFVTDELYKAIKKEIVTTVYAGTTNDKLVQQGFVGTLDGVKVILVPSTYFATRTVNETAPHATFPEFVADPTVKGILWDRNVMLAGRKLSKAQIKTDSEFGDGALLLGHWRFGNWTLDANNTKKAVSIIQSA